MQTSSARNVALVPPQCPTTEAPRAVLPEGVLPNGYIKSLKQLVHFYTPRDVFPFDVTSGHCPSGKTEKVDCWPMPEVKNTEDMTVGMLGLDRYGGEPDRCLPPNAYRRLHKTLSQHQYLYRFCMTGGTRLRPKAMDSSSRLRLCHPARRPCAAWHLSEPPIP